MESFLSRYKNALVLIIVLLAQVVGLAVQVRRPAADGSPDAEGVRLIRYWVISVIAPPERLLHLGGGGIRGLWNNYLDDRVAESFLAVIVDRRTKVFQLALC